MARITFYPLGNADSSLTEFNDGRFMLIDYCHRKDPEDDDDKRVDLEGKLREVLEDKERNFLDIVVFSHADSDHCDNAEKFFWLEHAAKYQTDERVKIEDMWVPACYILEEGLKDSARVIRQEARHRLKEGKGIHVFGEPGCLDEWFQGQNIDLETRKHLIIHAGTCVPEFGKDNGQAEVFVHSPFSFRMEGDEEDRNNSSIVLHVTFFEGDRSTRVMFGADAEHEAWSDIVKITNYKKRPERLIWDVFKISHHCSYTALAPEKGDEKTEPVEDVKHLFEQCTECCYLVSSSEPIPDEDTKQPPHKQAAKYYEDVVIEKTGDFLVTMEEPTRKKPRPIIIEITGRGANWKKITGVASGIGAVVSRPSARQG